jgi:hypothetical protein
MTAFRKSSMLNYCKAILQKVSFNRKLFLKEYRKSHSWLSASEIGELRSWVRNATIRNQTSH